VDPNQISSVNMPSLDWVRNLAETLQEDGVEEDDVFNMNPGVLNFIRYLMHDIEELEGEVFQLRERSEHQAGDLKRIRAQRIALLFKVQRLTGEEDVKDIDLSQTSLRVIKMHKDEHSGAQQADDQADA